MDLPSEDSLRWLVRTYAQLRAVCAEAIGPQPALVQPTGEFFPDEFRPDAASIERLLRRVMSYAPLAEDLGTELVFLEHEGSPSGGGCGSGACGTGGGSGLRSMVQELDDGYRVGVPVVDVSNPDVLTTGLARAVGTLVLCEAGLDADDAAEAEIAASACGLGVLLTNGAAVWAKSCGGLRMAQATVLPVEEAAVVLALFAAAHGVKSGAARAHLGATQREAFDLATDWVESNPLLVEALRDHPGTLASGLFHIEPVKGLLGRWLHKRKLDKDLQTPPEVAPISEDKRRRLAEARALVDEVLGTE